ncbi:MAG: hypothetical protein RBG13Loki_0395 [Promethearchaeota archaeon CR_4]|nr:MAG: hypothetical protein RBG13Loki_0395 [Candidatus Lokiarchaeota archaeon CR_4]
MNERAGVFMRSTKEKNRRMATCLSLILCLSIVPTFSSLAKGSLWQENATEFSPRESIKAVIEVVPGVHFRGIMETVNRTNGVVQYHLRHMEINREIFPVNFGHLKGYFPASMRKLRRKELLTLIAVRHPLRNAIIKALLESSQTLGQLAALCGVEANKVLFHLKKLSEEGIIKPLDVSPSKFGIAEDIVNCLQCYAFSTSLPVIYS